MYNPKTGIIISTLELFLIIVGIIGIVALIVCFIDKFSVKVGDAAIEMKAKKNNKEDYEQEAEDNFIAD